MIKFTNNPKPKIKLKNPTKPPIAGITFKICNANNEQANNKYSFNFLIDPSKGHLSSIYIISE